MLLLYNETTPDDDNFIAKTCTEYHLVLRNKTSELTQNTEKYVLARRKHKEFIIMNTKIVMTFISCYLTYLSIISRSKPPIILGELKLHLPAA